jgi:hypothetical protein
MNMPITVIVWVISMLMIRRESLIPLCFLFSVDIDLHRRDATRSHAFGGQADWTNAQGK